MRRSGFTLVELLVVLLIVAMVSAVALPAILTATRDRRMDEAARLVQAQASLARDLSATGRDSGFRLAPDPSLPLPRLADGRIDPAAPLAYSQVVPLKRGEDYTTGRVRIDHRLWPPGNPPGWPAPRRLVLEEQLFDPAGGRSEPTSWAWNVRVGEKVLLAGRVYTVAGPMVMGPGDGNPELFVNYGPPGSAPPLSRLDGFGPREILYLVNGLDDDGDGFVDEGLDGLDNDLDGFTDEDDEWEVEIWGDQVPAFDVPPFVNEVPDLAYAIRRRPVPDEGGAVQLPAGVVVDATGWGDGSGRSRLPVDPWTGSVDLLISAQGAVSTASAYSTPAADTYGPPWILMWLADLGDVASPPSTAPAAAKLVGLNKLNGFAAAVDADPADPEAARKAVEGR